MTNNTTTAQPGLRCVEHVPGQAGKGWLLPDGGIATWRVGPRGGPHHLTRYRQLKLPLGLLPPTNQATWGWQPREGLALPFNITSTGTLLDDDWETSLATEKARTINRLLERRQHDR